MRLRVSIAPVCVVLLVLLGGPARGTPADAVRGHLIVRFQSEGDRALEECAESLYRRGAPFASATADGSDSLDHIHQRFAVRSIRAAFTETKNATLAERRRVQRERLRASRRPALRNEPIQEPPDLAHVYKVEIADPRLVDEALRAYAADAHVVWVQRDHEHRLDSVPDDPFLASSGSWNQPYEDLWGLLRIRAPEAWSISQGEGVVVAVVDTGLDYDHPDIAANVFVHPGEDLDGNGRVDATDWNGVDDDGNGFVDDLRGFDFASSLDADGDGFYDGPDDVSDADPFDDDGHGTHVSGTIAALAGNGIGIAGVAPRARIMPLKGFGSGSAPDSLLWRAVVYAIENGADVVNNSWSCSPACPENPLAEDVAALARAMDVVIVTSAGNRQSDVIMNSPENGRDVITVAATGQDDELAEAISNFGWGIDISAPGGGPGDTPGVAFASRNILSLRTSADDSDSPFAVGGQYLRNAGTSMASPHVAGVVALLRSAEPELRYEDIRRILRQSAVDVGRPGHDRMVGPGRLDAWAALTHSPLPDLFAEITHPAQRATLTPDAGVVEVRGRAGGDDLLAWTLRYGRGNDPAEWTAIRADQTATVQNGTLGGWDVSGLEQGSYVLELAVTGIDGSIYREFLQVSLERGHFDVVSSPGQPVGSPSISGSLVVWQSNRSADDPDQRSDDANLFLTDLGTGAEYALQTGPFDQRSPSISRGLISWLDDRHGPGLEVFGCRFGRQTRRCDAVRAAPGVKVTLPPASVSRHIFFVDPSAGSDLRGCRLDVRRGRCAAVDSGLAPGGRSFVRSDGRSLAWVNTAGRLSIGVCPVDARTGACDELVLRGTIPTLSRPAASGDHVAWVEFSPTGRHPLKICKLDRATGDCFPVVVVEDIRDVTPVLSGNRLVWDAAVGDEASDVFFCELDAVRERCPVQRITAQLSPQGESAISGDRVVWIDERGGAARIQGTRLPSLLPIRDRRVRAGDWIWLPVRATDPLGGPVRMEAELASGEPLTALGARFLAPGHHGRAWLIWRPRLSQRGPWRLTFSASTLSGLVTRRTVTLEVVAPPGLRARTP